MESMHKKADRENKHNQKDLIDAKRNLSYTKYVLFLALVLGSIGLFWGFIIGAIIFGVLIALWGVSTYIAYMHYLSAKKRSE